MENIVGLLVLFFALTKAENQYFATLGSNATIPCNVTTTINFKGSGIDVNKDTYTTAGGLLVVRSVTESNLGEYKCDGKVYKLMQEAEPKFTKVLPRTKYGLVDTEMLLECSVKSSSPTTSVSWWKDDEQLSNDDQRITTNEKNNIITSTLSINTVQDSATYKCAASYKGRVVISNSTKVVIFKFGDLQLSAPNISADSIWIRLNGDELFQGTEVVIEMQTEAGKLIEKKIISDQSERIVKFDKLNPYTSYLFVAYEKAGDNIGIEQKISLKTLESAPTPPRNVRSGEVTEDSFVVKWDQPEQLNGIVRAFRVTYSFINGSKIETQNVTFKLTQSPVKREMKMVIGVYAFVNYNVSVQEKTIKYSEPNFTEIQTTTGAPRAPQNLRKQTSTSTSVTIVWDAIPSYLQGGVLQFYRILVPQLNNTANENVGANVTSYTLTGLRPFTDYVIKVLGITNKNDGEEAELTTKTEEAPPSEPRDLRGEAKSQNTVDGRQQYVSLAWNPPVHENGDISSFEIRYKKTCVESVLCRPKRTFQEYKNVSLEYSLSPPDATMRVHHISNLDAFTQYLFQVREGTSAGWGNYSDSLQVATLEGNPSPPLDVSYKELTDDSITFVWSKPLHPNGIITLYTVHLKSGDGLKLYRAIERRINDDSDELVMEIDNLNSETTYQLRVKASTDKGRLHGKDSDVLKFTTKVKSTGFPWHFVLIGCLAIVLFIALIIAIFVLVSRRRAKYEEVQTNENLDLTAINKSKVVSINELKNYCAQQHANSDHGFQQEFESVRIPVHTFTWEHSQMPCNQSKNRYSNIVAYDHSRVILNVIDNDPSSTYINANFVNGYQHQKKYIAAQGPLPETVLDFWRMIWEQNTPIIVMLTKLVEDNKIKCEQYWPEGKALQYKDIVVTVNSISEMTDYVVRVFTLHKINNPELGKREVRQFHYTAWPDHGVPSHPTSMLSFVRHVMSSINNRRQDGPMVVHCSAGVGRTGTFIAIESSLRQIEHDQNIDVYGTVCRMRMQRNFMVQIEAQYTFIYDALLDSVICGNTEIPPTDLVAKIRFLNQVDHKSGKTHFHEEFKRLESGIASTESSFVDASHMENKQKNRLLNILPYDHNRVKLVPIAGCRQSDYVNASIVDGFQQRNAFIATQAPLENTVTDFWRMVQERNIHIIVMLTKLVEKGQEKCYLYWPQAGTVSYGNIYVELVNVQQEEEHIVLHELRLTNRETGKSWMVSHFMYLGWPDTGSPKSGTELINLIGCVQRAQKLVANGGPTLVHCSGGVGRTGVFIAVFNCIEKLKAKDVVDVFQTIRQLRLQRVAMVQTLDQYIFCYQALKDYLDSFDLYTNVEC